MLGCKISPEVTFFQRKHYDYPDLSSGYQRTSIPIGYEETSMVCVLGKFTWKRIWPVQTYLGLVDFKPFWDIINRNSYRTDMTSPESARTFLRELIRVLEYMEAPVERVL
jgi:aspartyl-tRNA(Asn)/glutamyl-tRNA(Gln) amidotransferase subunit B